MHPLIKKRRATYLGPIDPKRQAVVTVADSREGLTHAAAVSEQSHLRPHSLAVLIAVASDRRRALAESWLDQRLSRQQLFPQRF